MKTAILICLTLTLTATVIHAQTSETLGREKMKVFANWAGQWKGEGTMQNERGESKKTTVDETIQMKLDGMIVLIEGVGHSSDASGTDQVVHHALGVLSFNQIKNQYEFNSFLKDGRSADAWFNVVGSNEFHWGFDVQRGKIKYTIKIDEASKTWNEVGEFSSDGNTWWKFFEMKLKKQS